MDWKVAMERFIRVNQICKVNRRKICTERKILFPTILWASCLLVVLMLGGCGCKTMYSKTTGGTIYIGQPQVLSRESVVPERQLELEWLRGQLAKTPNEASFQGLSDNLISESLKAAISININPLQGKILNEQSKLEIDQLTAARSKLALERQIEEEKLSNQLKKVKDEKLTQETLPSASPLDQSKLEDINKQISKMDKDIKAIQGTLNGTKSNQDSPPDLQNTRARKTAAALTPVELLRDQMAYRTNVHAARREKMLDETHDLMGRMLYEMKFSVTIVPPQKQGLTAFVRLSPLEGEEIKANEHSYSLFINRLTTLMTYEYHLLKGELAHNHPPADYLLLSGCEKQDAQQMRSLYLKDSATTSVSDSSVRSIPDFSIKIPDECKDKKHRIKYVQKKYSIFDNLFEIKNVPDGVIIETAPYNDASKKVFDTLLAKLPKDYNTIRVTSVEPKEYAQNISDISARQSLLELTASLTSILQGGAAAGGNVGYSKETKTFLEAIKRQPLALGFTDKDNLFGWILGPKLVLERGKACYAQVPATYPLTATVVAPAWLSELKFNLEYGWINKDGKETSNGTKETSNGTSESYLTVPLVPDFQGIIETLRGETDGIDRRPRIIIPEEGFSLAQDGDQRLLIRGLNLWRNPEVYVGNVRAYRVDILPDMLGIYAYFNSPIEIAAGNKSLTVATTANHEHLSGVVKILPAEKSKKPEAFASVAAPYIVWGERTKDQEISVAIDTDRSPSILPVFDGYAYKAGLASRRISARVVSVSSSRLTLLVPKELSSSICDTDIIAVDVRIYENPDDMFGLSVMQYPKTIVVFKKDDDTKLEIKGADAKTSTKELMFDKSGSVTVELHIPVKETTYFCRAYPAFSDSMKLTLEGETPEGSSLKLADLVAKSEYFKNGNFEFTLSKEIMGQSTAMTVQNLSVSYDKGTQKIPILQKIKLRIPK
jgi:hypothetical protein